MTQWRWNPSFMKCVQAGRVKIMRTCITCTATSQVLELGDTRDPNRRFEECIHWRCQGCNRTFPFGHGVNDELIVSEWWKWEQERRAELAAQGLADEVIGDK